MSSVDKLAVANPSAVGIPLQDASQEIWAQKYQLKDRRGGAVDKDVNDSYRRVARACRPRIES